MTTHDNPGLPAGKVPGLSLQAQVLRGFATDFLTAHQLPVVEWIMDPDYRLNIGAASFAGRDGFYLPATGAQLEQFPGLCVTVHDVLLGTDGVAMRFTEHGVSKRHGRAAAWGGITLFTLKDGRLGEGWANEDYFARKRQLATGQCDAVRAPHPAPWDVPTLPPDETVVANVRQWLQEPAALLQSPDVEQIASEGPRLGTLLLPREVELQQIVGAGDRCAFHLRLRGAYLGGFEDVDAAHRGREVDLSVSGLVTWRAGQPTGVQISFDRLGLNRSFS